MADRFDFADVLDEAIALSGGESTTADDVLSARRSLHLLLIEWNNRSFNTWRVKHETFSVGRGGQVLLPTRIDDVIQVSSNNPETQVDFLGSQANMKRISATEYANLTVLPKGRPSMYYLERSEPPRLYVYPIGREDVRETLEVWYVQRPDEFDRLSNIDPDLPQRWLNAMVSGVAVRMAKKRPGISEERIARLERDYERDLEICTNSDRERVGFAVRLGRRGNVR